MLAAIMTPSRIGIITSFSTLIRYCGWLNLPAGKPSGSIVCMISGFRVLLYKSRSCTQCGIAIAARSGLWRLRQNAPENGFQKGRGALPHVVAQAHEIGDVAHPEHADQAPRGLLGVDAVADAPFVLAAPHDGGDRLGRLALPGAEWLSQTGFGGRGDELEEREHKAGVLRREPSEVSSGDVAQARGRVRARRRVDDLKHLPIDGV